MHHCVAFHRFLSIRRYSFQISLTYGRSWVKQNLGISRDDNRSHLFRPPMLQILRLMSYTFFIQQSANFSLLEVIASSSKHLSFGVVAEIHIIP